MIIRHVRLTNILSHESSEVSFPDGIVAIVGPNGAGKSSIIDSIYTALFTDASIDIRGRKKEFLVMRGKRKGEIEVLLDVGGVKYSVFREIWIDSPAQAALYLLDREGRRVKSVGVSNVVNELGRILGLTAVTAKDLRSIVRSTVISLQDELTKIVDVSDSERREWILSLLGLSYLEKSLEVVKKYTSKRDRLEGRLESEKVLLNSKKNELSELKSRKNMLMSKILEAEKVIEDLKKKYDTIAEKARLSNEGLELLDKLKPLIIVRRVKELENLVSKLAILDGWDVNDYLQTRREHENLVGELASIRSRITALLQGTSSKLGVNVDSYESLSTLLAQLRARSEELAGSINHAKALKELYSVYVEKLESRRECPICGSLISDPAVIKSHLTQELVKLNERIKELSNEHTASKMKIAVAQTASEELGKLISKAEVVEKSLQKTAEKLNQLNNKAFQLCSGLAESFMSPPSLNECVESLSTLKNKLVSYRGELEFLNNLKGEQPSDIAGLDAAYIQDRLAQIFAKLVPNVGVPRDLKDLDSARKRLAEVSRELNSESESISKKLLEVDGNKKALEALLKEVDGRMNVLDAEIKEIEKRIKEIEAQIKAYSVIHEFCLRYLGKNGLIARELTRLARDELERRANRILTKLGLRPIEIGDDFQIRVKVLGGELPIGNASGGERVGISIALRLALAELIMGRAPTTLILDEPTVYLDEERRKQVFEIIKELSKSLRQVIVVTHDESVMNIADKIIKVENVGEISRVSS